jgi:hypothetical protein
MGDRYNKHLNQFIVYGIDHSVVPDTVAIVACIISLEGFDVGV